ncbi:MAG: hypothetical protein G01um101419_554 [Parcubacteria group bacterium Gr01-1014_19]|nr:MAG: hypothetical protein G01um101419_554 [Parcubacteria group bacterium Gr01-1014_19]
MIQLIIAVSFFAVAALIILAAVAQEMVRSIRFRSHIPAFKKGDALFWSSFGRLMVKPEEIAAAGTEPLRALAVKDRPEEWDKNSFHPQAVILQTRDCKVKMYSGAYFQKAA